MNSVALGGYLPVSSYRLNGGWLNDVQMPRPSETTLLIWPFFCWVGIPVVTNAESLPFWQFRSVQVASRWKGSRTCDFSQDGLLSPRVQNCIFVWFFYFYYYFSATRYMHWHVSPLPCNQPEFFSFFSLSLSLHPRQECVGVIIQQCARQVLTPPLPQTSGVQVGGKEKVERPENNHRHC